MDFYEAALEISNQTKEELWQMKKAEELFQRFVKGCKAIPKIGGMLAAGGRIGVTTWSMSYK